MITFLKFGCLFMFQYSIYTYQLIKVSLSRIVNLLKTKNLCNEIGISESIEFKDYCINWRDTDENYLLVDINMQI